MVLELSVFMLVVFVANASEGMPLLLKPCIKGAENQTYAVVVVPPYVSPAAVKSGKGFCLDIVGVPAGKARAGNSVEATPCGRNQMNLRANQYWAVKTNNLVSLQVMDTPYCFGITETRAGMLTNCSSSDADFTVGFKGKNAGTLIHTETGLCVTASGIPPPMPGPPPPRPPSPPNTPCSTPAPAPPSPPAPAPADARPCDIYDAAGTPCVAAHSMVRALYSSYAGPLYMVSRSSDHTTKPIPTTAPGGFAVAAMQDEFCAGTECTVETIFDQSPRGNHLRANHPGRHYPVDRGVNASRHPIMIAGNRVYGAWFDPGMGYRNDNTSGMALGQEAESIYAVFGGGHYNDVCCFDYGNAENHIGADGPGTMEAIYFGNCTSWWVPSDRRKIPANWHGPYLMADIEAGMYAGNDTFNPQSSPINFDFVSLMLKGRECEMSLKAGNAQTGELATKYDGGRPTHADYHPMRKQGGLILGTGGDNSDRALGIFYEGAITRGYASAATDNAIQANIVAAGYDK